MAPLCAASVRPATPDAFDEGVSGFNAMCPTVSWAAAATELEHAMPADVLDWLGRLRRSAGVSPPPSSAAAAVHCTIRNLDGRRIDANGGGGG